MRAVCESCARPQPVDWRAGDLCVHCGGQARAEERCFWCNTWQPAGGFCRGCGAEQVGHEAYGAARMLTLSGADMFSIPKMVREMDPARLAVFGDKYARQRALVSRHVDDLSFVEGFLKHKGWAAELEDELVTSLPWSDDTAAAYKHAGAPAEGVERLQAIIDRTPFEQTQCLATIAMLWSQQWDQLRKVASYTRGGGHLAHEAALAVTWWRTATACGLSRHQVPLDTASCAELSEEVAVRLAWFEREADPVALANARASRDPDLALAAAMVTGDMAVLRASLTGDLLTQQAAAASLAARGETAALLGWLRGADPDAQRDVIRVLAHDEDGRAGVLTPMLLDIMEASEDERLIVDIGRLLARETTLAVAVRIAAACRREIYVVQALMKEDTGLAPADLAVVGAELVKRGYLRHSMYGVSEAARRGAFPDDFVPGVFELGDAEQKIELCRVAEEQLRERDIEVLHAFLLRTVFGPQTHKVRAAAWWALSRGYARQKYGWFGPFELTVPAIERFFGGVPAFMEGFIGVLEDYDTLKEVGLFDFLHRITADLDTERIDALRAYPPCERLFAAMDAASRQDVWPFLKKSLERAVRRYRGEEEAA